MEKNINELIFSIKEDFSKEISSLKIESARDHSKLDTVIDVIQKENIEQRKIVQQITVEVDEMQNTITSMAKNIDTFIIKMDKASEDNNHKINSQNEKIDASVKYLNESVVKIERRVSNFVKWISISVGLSILMSLIFGLAGMFWKLGNIEENYISNLTKKHAEIIHKIENINKEKSNNRTDIEVMKEKIKALEKGK